MAEIIFSTPFSTLLASSSQADKWFQSVSIDMNWINRLITLVMVVLGRMGRWARRQRRLSSIKGRDSAMSIISQLVIPYSTHPSYHRWDSVLAIGEEWVRVSEGAFNEKVLPTMLQVDPWVIGKGNPVKKGEKCGRGAHLKGIELMSTKWSCE